MFANHLHTLLTSHDSWRAAHPVWQRHNHFDTDCSAVNFAIKVVGNPHFVPRSALANHCAVVVHDPSVVVEVLETRRDATRQWPWPSSLALLRAVYFDVRLRGTTPSERC